MAGVKSFSILRAALLAGAMFVATSTPLRESAASAQSEVRRQAPRPRGGLTPFSSDQELRTYLLSRRPPPPPPPPAQSSPPPAGSTVVTGTRIPRPNLESATPVAVLNSQDVTVAGTDPSITNNQEAGVDEGDIVKVRGNNLVILRRGRLFTVSLAGGGLRPIDSIDAFPPGVSGRGDWYDEMLVSGDLIVVIGYSYARGGTEINRFRLSPDGHLRFQDAYHLRSNDYYSSRNYASRLIGNRLIMYTPLELDWSDDPLEVLPGVRRWQEGGSNRAFLRIAAARQIYKPPTSFDRREIEIDTLHTVIDCNVTAPTLDCTATGVLGPESRTFYVSGEAVYLWTADDWYDDKNNEGVVAFMYRLPLDRRRPAAVGVRGAPVDQFSFREDLEDGLVNVLVRSEGGGDAMWRPEVTDGDVALLRLPIRDFGDGSREARLSRYRPLPRIAGADWNFHNRFVGGHILYGGSAYGARPDGGTLMVAPLDGGPVAQLELAHGVDRLEVLGQDGLVVGGGENALGFTAIELNGRAPRIGDLFRLPAAQEGETRSHAFFFNPETPDGASGMLGLPIARAVEPAYHRFFGSAAAMLFLSRQDRRFAPAGELGAEVRGGVDDACQASCVDWYGNARPIFLGNRTFALLGYELVEGRREGRRISERRRVSFAPVATAPERVKGN